MTLQETGHIMDLLTVAYPRFYSGTNAPDMKKTLKLWTIMFADDPFELVIAAVKALIVTDTKGFPPHIGAVKEKIRQLTAPEQMTEAEAWGKVQRALSNSLYNASVEFDALPPDIQRLVGSPNQLREWAMMDVETVQSVVSSNFMRSYRVRAKQREEFDALPSDVRKLIGSLAGRFAMPSDELLPSVSVESLDHI